MATRVIDELAPLRAEFPRLGAILGEDGVCFRVWAPGAERVAVSLYARDIDGPAALGEHALAHTGGGVYEATLQVPRGALYKFRVGDRELPDPYARGLPYGVHGPAEIVADTIVEPGDWWPRRLSACVIYELHVGTFTPEGSFAAAAARLPELLALGITAIELMPVASFSGRHGWGYDGVAHFAPHAAYGGADELRALVAAAHRLGMNALLDVVYNHFGPEGNYLGAYSPEYFTRDVTTPWGQALNYAAPAMRRLVIDSVRRWLTEFGFDGLRLDATHAMHDRSGRTILRELVAEVRGLGRGQLLIAEDETIHPDLIVSTGLDAMWADDFHHIVHTLLTGERDGYYDEYPATLAALARCIERGNYYEGGLWRLHGRPRGGPTDELPASAFVYCLQNHDQVGNRAFGERLNQLVGIDRYCAASALLLFLPMTPLLWMGQEWAAGTPWRYFTDLTPELGAQITAGRRAELGAFAAFRGPASRERIPDPQAESTLADSRLDWDEREREPHCAVLELYRALLLLRRDDPVLADNDRKRMSCGTDATRLWVRRASAAGERLLVVDLGEAPDLRPPAAVEDRSWTVLLDTGGQGLPRARAVIYGDAVAASA